MKKFLVVVAAGLLLVGCGTAENEPVEEAEQTGAPETEEVTEEEGYLTAEEFIERAPEGKTYSSYATELLLWGSAQEVRYMDTIDTDKEEYGAYKVDIIKVEDGFVAVAFDGEEITGSWTFETVEELREEIQVEATE
ncbi:hypothetical protein [Alkalihalobacterium alkalinitrilicum]|uniref:hypothetical protein n=1 Tax=Alkalihalobacterium alkalinitrilicum TaxID=427920 RepID=UPI000994C3C8|nr:hypothetical protein [Alkalihalobacterium alkalinitrilicum]